MRTIETSAAFRRDFKRVQAAPRHRDDLKDLLENVVARLASDENLPSRNRDHALSGNWAGHRECHVKPDLLLIYLKPTANTLQLVRLGSHSDLFSQLLRGIGLRSRAELEEVEGKGDPVSVGEKAVRLAAGGTQHAAVMPVRPSAFWHSGASAVFVFAPQ